MPTGTPPEGRVNQLTAYALLSRVYMHQSDFDNALDMAENVIASGQFQLNDDVTTFWRDEFSREGIWEIAHTLTENPEINTALPVFYAEGARDDIQLSEDNIVAAENIIDDDQQTELDT